MDQIYEVLKKYFGYSSFRTNQEEIIRHILSGQDAMVIMPTGGGKSICYQLPALVLPHLTIVVSPLIALMNDQVSALKENGIAAAAWHSNISDSEQRTIEQRIMSQQLKLLYVSPEKLKSRDFMAMLGRVPISLVAIDEAHCVSVWGNDFRPDYLVLGDLRKQFRNTPFVALTATADASTQHDIAEKLHLQQVKTFINSFERKNITISALPGQDKFKQIVQFIHQQGDHSGIIYCLSRKGTEDLAQKLQKHGIPANFYHAGMGPDDREKVQQRFTHDEVKIICATIAFGMGIDKSNIRWVIHHNMPKNLEGFYQEIGRSGRDGSPAQSILFYSWNDFSMLKSFIDDSPSDEVFRNVQHAKLDRMWEFSTTSDCRTNMILSYFGEYRVEGCGHCDNCLFPPKTIDGKVLAQKALSAVIRSGEKLSLQMLILLLRGSREQELLEKGFDQIKTYGAGLNIPFPDWRHYITQMINRGYLRIDYTDHSHLKATPLSKNILDADFEFRVTAYQDPGVLDAGEKKSKKASVSAAIVRDQSPTARLLAELKMWRSEKAAAQGVAPFVVFHDATLEEIVQQAPKSLEELSAIAGIGNAKLNNYGFDVLKIVRKVIYPEWKESAELSKSLELTYLMYQQGLSPEEIAAEREINVSTVFSHLSELYLRGRTIKLEQFITQDQKNMVADAIQKVGHTDKLKPLFDACDGQIPYHIIRVGITLLQNK